jgi:hypothetical protein
MNQALSLMDMTIVSSMPNVLNCAEALFLIQQSNRYSIVRYSLVEQNWELIYQFPTMIPTSNI